MKSINFMWNLQVRYFHEISLISKEKIAFAKQGVEDYVIGKITQFPELPNPPKIPEDSLDFIYFSIFDFRARYGFDIQRAKKRIARQQVRQSPQVFYVPSCTHTPRNFY